MKKELDFKNSNRKHWCVLYVY